MELDYRKKLKEIFYGNNKKAYVHSFGCQLNVSDGEKIKGILKEIGFSFTDSPEDSDIIILNTCAVRESAEERVFGIIGSMKKLKAEKPDLIIGVSGCMTAQEKNLERIKKSYPQVDIVLGTSAINSLPGLIYEHLNSNRFAYDISEYADFSCRAEQVRESSFKASVPIMFGCNNFCTYCIVPYVRGRERSRNSQDIIDEVTALVNQGYKEIMLLGQNVNSYGKDLENDMTFPELLREINKIEGDFIIRFMSSHPKDATKELLDTILECDKVAKHLHLPVQSGSNSILRAMNRNYTVEKYLETVKYLRERYKDFSLTTDIIVGFPNETDEEFQDTVRLIKQVEYDNIYSFIYSKRSGTKASEISDTIPEEVKSRRMRELLEVQREISDRHYKRFVGKTMRVLADGKSRKHEGFLTGKSNEFIIAEFEGDESLIGSFVNIKVTDSMNWAVTGEII
ncbi:MAG: tRNA (N6-isopentenyl adenosine(37)-C2)-methylthiotransferase MiaB [Oscillospiraceae bacterium]|nr:tRNA (N6-isopentenyl adenosine(37)-C2)-methylthiotransferase MiaB [Oscillospiraceae bacterium]